MDRGVLPWLHVLVHDWAEVAPLANFVMLCLVAAGLVHLDRKLRRKE